MGALSSLKQPKAFYMIFFIELWERFGFYGMQGIVTLYMVQVLGLSDAKTFNTYSAFTALLYALIVVGGYIGDNVLGTKRTIVFGGIVLAIGYIILGLGSHNYLFLGLGTVAIGNGLFKANPPSLLSKCYEPGDSRLSGAFTLYYMAVNIGSFISLLLVPYLAKEYNWGIGFLVCAIGLFFALGNYFLSLKWIKDIGSAIDHEPMAWDKFIMVLGGTIIACFAARWLLEHLTAAHWTLVVIVAIFYIYFFKIGIIHGKKAMLKLLVAFILMLEAVVFFSLYQQMPTSLNFFAIHNIQHSILGFHINPLSFQALNPFWIIVLSPILAFFYNHFGKKGRDLSMPTKFAIGMLLCSFAFMVLPLGAQYANAQGIVSSWWIILSYFLQSFGELLVSGLGLAMIAQYVPRKYMGFLMGGWYMNQAGAMVLGGFVASRTSIPKSITSRIEMLPIYSHVFWEIGITTFIVAIAMFILVPVLNRMGRG